MTNKVSIKNSIIRVCLLCLASFGFVVLSAEPPKPVKKSQAGPSFLLWMDPALSREALAQSPFFRKVEDDSVRFCPTPEWTKLGFQGHLGGWALVERAKGLVAEGDGGPQPEDLRNAMQRAGWRDRPQELKETLAGATGWGEGWVLRLRDLSALALKSYKHLRTVRPQASTQALAEDLGDSFWQEVAEALRGLRAVDGWWESPSLSLSLAVLAPGVHGNPSVRYEWEQMGGGLLEVLRAHPAQERAWGLSILLEQAQDLDSAKDRPRAPGRILANLRSVEVVPGDPWPDFRMAESLLSALGSDPDTLMAIAQWGLASTPTDPEAGQAQAAWRALEAHALIQLGRRQEAIQRLEAQHENAGRAWIDCRDLVRHSTWLMGGAMDEEMRAILAREPLPGPQDILPKRLPLVLQFDPGDLSHWQALAKTPTLRAWGPDELQWRPLAAEVSKGGSQTGWRLMEGESIRAKGAGRPTEKIVAAALASVRTPALDGLNQFAQRHPSHLGVREARLRLLGKRPDAASFAATMLEDAAMLYLLPPIAADLPSKEASDFARRQIARIEARLCAWPSRLDLWETWASWWMLAGDRNRGARLLRALPERGQWAGGEPVPVEIGLKVAERLLKGPDPTLARAWCQTLWQLGYHALEAEDADPSEGLFWQTRARSIWKRAGGMNTGRP